MYSYLFLKLSSSTCSTLTINVNMSISPTSIAALLSFLNERPKPQTNRLILLLIYLTIFGVCQDSWVKFNPYSCTQTETCLSVRYSLTLCSFNSRGNKHRKKACLKHAQHPTSTNKPCPIKTLELIYN